MKTNWLAAIVLVASLVVPSATGAHEGHTHKALGTIASIHGELVKLKTTDGKTLTVALDKKTTFTRGKDKLDATALKVGERVSVDYMEVNKKMMAHAFKLGTASAGK